METFIDAMHSWVKAKNKFVLENSSPKQKRLSPRKNIMLTIPMQFEQEIKEFVKSKRKEADSLLEIDYEKENLSLELQYEKENPPPKAGDF